MSYYGRMDRARTAGGGRKVTELRSYPGWIVRKDFFDNTYVAVHRPTQTNSPRFNSFAAAIKFIRENPQEN